MFFRREFPKVVRTVFLVVRDAGRAEELSQEAFIALFRHWKRVSDYDRPKAWVRRVAIRFALRTARRDHLRSVLERGTVTPESADAGSDLTDAIRQLTTSQRAAIVLHYYEDLPVEQVAVILDCTENTVKSHLHRGRNKLRLLLEEGHGGSSGS